jgi:tRNA(fMet)-specific endonuclease VapC
MVEGMYLFDTDSICNILKKRPSQKLLEKLSALPSSSQFITTITISEIVYGALKCQHSEYHMRNLEELLLPNVNVLAFDSKAAYICGRLRHAREARGITSSFTDLQIASIAISNDMTLVTGNLRHFMCIDGLTVENWI